MRGLASRVDRLEMRRGADGTERWLRSLSDEQLAAEIARCDAKCREVLSAHGVDPSDMSTDDLLPALQALEDAATANAALK
jgi:hypothetical protein